jgi:hypothetical protein
MKIDNVVRYAGMFSFTLALVFFNSLALASSCAEFEADAEAFGGVVPRFDENGKVRAILMYGESSFITPKRSLIANARRKAELDARRAFAEFLKSDFDSNTVSANLVETASLTDDSGTTGSALELSSTLNVMRQNSEATLSGIAKLDECVDTEGKYLLVQLGWKPALSAGSADAKQAMNNPSSGGKQSSQATASHASVGVGSGAESSSSGGAQSSQAKVAQSSDNAKPGVELVSLEVEGRGINLKSATNEALKSAISQVFGEKFASQSSVTESVLSASVSDGEGSYGVALETSASTNAVQSETSGLIRSWAYIEKGDDSSGYKVVLSVVIPKYKSSLDPNKTTIIVIEPVAGSDAILQDQLFKDFASKVHSVLEQSLGQTAGLNVLDRQYLNLAEQEMGAISKSGNMEELAKLGNQAGGDLMLVPVIETFKYRLDSREIGGQTIERMVYNVTLSTKVIEVATSNIVDAKNFPIRNKKIKSDDPTIDMALFMAGRAVRHLSKSVGGGYAEGYADGRADANENKPDMKAVKEASKKTFIEAKGNVEDDW